MLRTLDSSWRLTQTSRWRNKQHFCISRSSTLVISTIICYASFWEISHPCVHAAQPGNDRSHFGSGHPINHQLNSTFSGKGEEERKYAVDTAQDSRENYGRQYRETTGRQGLKNREQGINESKWNKGRNWKGESSKSSPSPPPPPPPVPQSRPRYTDQYAMDRRQNEYKKTASTNPIHYNFPEMTDISQNENNGPSFDGVDSEMKFASARSDAVTRYSSTKIGRIKINISSALVGTTLGAFLGKSITGKVTPFAPAVAFIFFFVSLFRNAYGELSRSLGLAFIFTLGQIKNIRKRYTTGAHIRCILGLGSRLPFPPIRGDEKENPWNYQPMRREDPDFDMFKSLIVMTLVGSFCGSNVPFFPAWIGSLVGAVAFTIMTTKRTAKGDLVRSMGMRVVSLTGECFDITSKLNIGRKSGIVGGKVLDKLLILDKKHRIKDRMTNSFSWIYQKALKTKSQVENDIRSSENENNNNGYNSRDF